MTVLDEIKYTPSSLILFTGDRQTPLPSCLPAPDPTPSPLPASKCPPFCWVLMVVGCVGQTAKTSAR